MTRTLIIVAGAALSTAAFAADPVRAPERPAAQAMHVQSPQGAVVNRIVWPDGGGLEADPDVGMPALRSDGGTPPAMTNRR